MPDYYSQLAQAIIKRQELLIGPLAWDQAASVEGLQVQDHVAVTVVSADPRTAINDLVERYSVIFGQAAVEVSKEAARPLMVNLLPEQRPSLLQ